MTSKKVLITSAGVATAVNVINSLKKSKIYKCEIVACDMNKNAVGLYLADRYYLTPSTKDRLFFSNILDIIKKEKIDFIFPLHSSEIAIFSQHSNQLIEMGVGINMPDKKVVELCNDKKQFLHFLHQHNIPYPYTFFNIDDIKDYPVFIKKNRGSSSKGAQIIHSRDELLYYINNSEDEYIIQEYIDWPEVTVDCYVNNHKSLVGFVPRYRVKVKDGKSIVARTMYAKSIYHITNHVLKSLNYNGPCNLQLFYNKDTQEIKIIELNPRLAAGGLPLATEAGVNIPELMMLDYFETVPDELIPFKRNLTMYRYYSEIFI
jgi:carbamoyl-phosphate synthase large subunit